MSTIQVNNISSFDSGKVNLDDPVTYTPQVLHLQHQETSGTNNADTPVATTWTKITLNTEVVNQITGSSLASSVISLPAGTYKFRANYNITANQSSARIRLRNTTAGSTEVLGINTYGDEEGNTDKVTHHNHLSGLFTLGATSDLELQYYLTSIGGFSGLTLGNATTSGEQEVYADVWIEKVA